MPAVYAHYNGLVPQTCGVGVSGIFRRGPSNTGTVNQLPNMGGADWHVASYTNDAAYVDVYKDAYEQMKKRWKIAFQSSVRVNRRTEKRFFVVMFDTRSKKFKMNNEGYGWPL